ncbi:hypothetical protein GCM10027053_23860 [Intrasporangium mesophilum]
MSVFASTNALDLFTAWVPLAAAAVVPAYRLTLAPRLASGRLRRGRPVRIPVSRGARHGDDGSEGARISRVEGDGHIFGPRFHWVVPISGLSLVDPAKSFRVTDERDNVDRVHVPDRWGAPFGAAMSESGPTWSARSWRTRWLAAPTWTMAVVGYFAAMAALAGLLAFTSTQHVGTVQDTADSDCRVAVVDGGAAYTQWMRCGFDFGPGDDLTFYALGRPFEGEAYLPEMLVAMVAAPAGLALAFGVGHVAFAEVRRRRIAERRYVVDEVPATAFDRDNLWLDTYLPETAILLEWPDRPDALVDPEEVDGLAETDRAEIDETETSADDSLWWRFHAVRGGDGGWTLLLARGVDADEPATWVLTPDRQPALHGLARLPNDPPSSGWVRLNYPRSAGRDQAGQVVLDGWASYHRLRRVDDVTIASLREDLLGQLRDRDDERASRDG